ncbi:unnamed protein product [Brugia timori]|uniref:COesterase domain-containing protein n=1 Tax=Brugia timori TaxID=42155 RepID=A0A0R3QYN6_9BILA|nr:unnamed protein product [Brugia timori]
MLFISLLHIQHLYIMIYLLFIIPLLFITILIPVGIVGQNLEKSRSVWVEQGLLLGKIYKLADNYIQIFRGIPYAEAPIGPLRFKRPVKRARWHQEHAALDYGAPCLQFMEFHKQDKFAGSNMQKESEDCLFLNVFTPFNNEHVEGNFGIWDLVMALEWIQTNVKQLNGDPSKVTIMGESAGAAAVSVLAVSPRTKNLLHRAIMLSGSSTAGWAIHRFGQPAWSVNNIAAYIGCEKELDKQTIEPLLKASGLPTLSKECNMQEKIPECLIVS